ncbi:MAG: hypothetical protein KF755_11720 [Burkholderiaceae bacterium]|nr:hypothetical protein [Burkholderiaceae bacterium]
MAYFSPAQERPRQTKRFVTVREVEDMAAQGTREIVQDEGLVITDAAREAAHDLGVRIVKPAQQAVPQERTSSKQVAAPAAASATLREPAVVQRLRQAMPGVLPAVGASVGTLRVASAGAEPDLRGGAGASAKGDPLVKSLVDVVRTKLPVLTALAKKG